jgi:hypothetical protein
MLVAVIVPVVFVVVRRPVLVIVGMGMVVVVMLVAVGVGVGVGVGMAVIVGMVVMIVPVIMTVLMVMPVVVTVMIVAVVVAAGAVVMGGLLRAEGAADRRRGAALAAHQLGGGGGSRDVQHVRADLGLDVVAAELPGEAQEPGGVLRAHLQKVLFGGAHDDEAAVVEAQGVAVLQGAGLGQGHREGEAAGRRERGGGGGAAGMVEGDGVGDLVGADRRTADDGGGCQHGRLGEAGSGRKDRFVPVA